MHSAGTQKAKSPALFVFLGVTFGLCSVFFVAGRAPFAKPDAWSEKRWTIHLVNTVDAELGMIVCGLLALLFLVLAAVRYFRHRTHTQHETNAT